MNYKKEIDVLLDKYSIDGVGREPRNVDELINFEFELHDAITTELNGIDRYLRDDEITRYRHLGYDVGSGYRTSDYVKFWRESK